jgi:regulator of sigma E protease
MLLETAQNLFGGIAHYVVPFLLLITPIVFFHELGHFLMARVFGVRVETFSIGFGPEIFGWRDSKGTRWKISWIPLGGYVKFFGDLNAASIPDREQMDALSAKERSVAFPFKPLYQRALVVAAGPVANFVLAVVILAGFLLVFGSYISPPLIGKVNPGSAAAQAGLHVGDRILSVDGQSVKTFDEMPGLVWDHPGEAMTIVVRRANATLVLHVTPRLTAINLPGGVQKVGLLGIAGPQASQLIRVRYGLFDATARACDDVGSIVVTTLDHLGRILVSKDKPSELSGVIGIAKLSGDVAAVSFLQLFRLAALISVSIGLVNLFPIPVLDGGHLLYYGVEAVLGRPLGAKAQDVGFRLGLAVMLGLMLLAAWNDLVRLNLF